MFLPGFQKMIFDCYDNRINIVLVKTISRFARNTVDLLETVSRLKGLGVEIIFHQENLRTSEADNDILISALSAIAQAESESMGEAIKWGLKRGFLSGNSSCIPASVLAISKMKLASSLLMKDKQKLFVRFMIYI